MDWTQATASVSSWRNRTETPPYVRDCYRVLQLLQVFGIAAHQSPLFHAGFPIQQPRLLFRPCRNSGE